MTLVGRIPLRPQCRIRAENNGDAVERIPTKFMAVKPKDYSVSALCGARAAIPGTDEAPSHEGSAARFAIHGRCLGMRRRRS
jgi:hypothetical protein